VHVTSIVAHTIVDATFGINWKYTMNSTTQTTLHKTTKIFRGVEVEYVRVIETRGFCIEGKTMMPTGLDAKALASLRQWGTYTPE
jgi:hypothetical protein